MNLNDVKSQKKSDEEKIDLSSRTEDARKSNGIIDTHGKFFDRSHHSCATIRDSRSRIAARTKKLGISNLYYLN